MKVAIQCASPLLQRSLERFLSNHLGTLKHCDIVVRDMPVDDGKPALIVGSHKCEGDIQKPFSKSQLFLALEKRLDELHVTQNLEHIIEEHDGEESAEEGRDFAILERRISALTQEYQRNILSAVRAFYES